MNMKKEKAEQKEERKNTAWTFLAAALFIPGGTFVGIALGILFKQMTVSVLLGIGVGFILAALSIIFKKD